MIASAQLKIAGNGYVGINMSGEPTFNLQWYGTGCFWSTHGQLIFDDSGYWNLPTIRPESDWWGCLGTSSNRFGVIYADHVITRDCEETSDERVKENVRQLDTPLEKIKQIRGVKYDIKKGYFKTNNAQLNKKLEDESKNEIGFLAQELMKVFPEVVYLDSSNNQYSVKYTRLVPVLVEAIKQQQTQIEDLTKRVATMEATCCKKEQKSAMLVPEVTSDATTDIASLDQNIPNPFTGETTINCYIPTQTGTAMLCVYDMQGKQLQKNVITGKGKQTVNFNGNSLNAGMYLYALIIDGKEIDTKKMILTK